MFMMSLEIDRSGLYSSMINENFHEDEMVNESFEDDEFDLEFKLEEVQDVVELFPAICEDLQNSQIVKFRVEGFGEYPWPVSVSIDFMTVIEQVSDLLEFLNTPDSISFDLDFYEQGIQRTLVFNKINNLIKINCREFPPMTTTVKITTWGKNIEEDPIDIESLKMMICKIVKTFVSISNEICPTLTANIFFQNWCRTEFIANCFETV